MNFCGRLGKVLMIAVLVIPIVLVGTLGIQLLKAEQVAAQRCWRETLGRCEYEGYFTGLSFFYNSPGDPPPPLWDTFYGGCLVGAWGNAFVCGIWQSTDYVGVTNAGQFVGTVNWALNQNFDACRGTNPDSWLTDWDAPQNACFKAKARATHAAFMIFSMLGRNGQDFGNTPDSNYTGVQYAKLAFNDWANMVYWYEAVGRVNFNAYVAPPCAYGQTQTFNISRHGQDVVFVLGNSCAPPAETIVFSMPSGGTFEINKSCANVKGPITPLSYDFQATPNASAPVLTPTDDPNTATFQSSISLNRRAGPLTVSRNYFIRRGASDLAPFASFSESNYYNGGTTSFGYTQNGIPGLTLGDQVCQKIVVGPSAGKIDPTDRVVSPTVGNVQSEACSRFLHKPYSKVYGGDVFAGASFGTGCAVDTDAALLGHNRDADPYVGSGTQLAALALGQILGYGSAQTSSTASPRVLSFANTGAGYAPSTYGGDLGNSNAVCAPDFYARATADGMTPQNGTVVVGAQNLGLGLPDKQTIYVNGNVFITGNITYASGNYNNIDHIPSFRLIVRGNIYVEPGVTQLNGLFVAQPNPANPSTTGRFYTCASQSWATGHAPAYVPNPTDLTTTCGANRLTVYGAVVADQIKLTRTFGTLNHANVGERYNSSYPAGQGPAETFVYTPEAWLNGDISPNNPKYDTINTLPPLL